MSLMFDAPPAIVQEATAYAHSRGLTLECLMRDYLVELSHRKTRGRLLGAAAAYAKPSLRRRERRAFQVAMETKHAQLH